MPRTIDLQTEINIEGALPTSSLDRESVMPLVRLTVRPVRLELTTCRSEGEQSSNPLIHSNALNLITL
jgi:hypothetical protein